MGRLLIVALSSLASIFFWLWALSQLFGDGEAVGIASLSLAFVVTPAILLHVWRGQSHSSKCPEGKGLYPECLYHVSVENDVIQVKSPEGSVAAIAKNDIRELAIETNDSGPWDTDVWWEIKTLSSDFRFPQGATGEQLAMRWFETFVGYKDDEVIRAMGSTSNARFVCWTASE